MPNSLIKYLWGIVGFLRVEYALEKVHISKVLMRWTLSRLRCSLCLKYEDSKTEDLCKV